MFTKLKKKQKTIRTQNAGPKNWTFNAKIRKIHSLRVFLYLANFIRILALRKFNNGFFIALTGQILYIWWIYRYFQLLEELTVPSRFSLSIFSDKPLISRYSRLECWLSFQYWRSRCTILSVNLVLTVLDIAKSAFNLSKSILSSPVSLSTFARVEFDLFW